MLSTRLLTATLVCILSLALAARAAPGVTAWAAEVRATEAAFAATMAERDLPRFAEFIAEEAVFFSGGSVLRGKQAVVDGWTAHFATAIAPFAWAPETVEVLESGALALSSGPVFDPSGKKFATFTSIWRREADGRWRIIFDKGNPVCP